MIGNLLGEPQWWMDFGEVLELGSALVEDGTLDTPESVVYFFEKPWKYSLEYEERAKART